MKRRTFLTMIGGAALAPALPSLSVASAPVSAGAAYSRYQFGLAVFHARTRGHMNAAELISSFKLNAVQADAMMGEMSANGVLTRGVAAQPLTTAKPYVRRALDYVTDNVKDSLTDPDLSSEIPEIADAALRRCTGGAQEVHADHPPIIPNQTTTSCGPKLGVS